MPLAFSFSLCHSRFCAERLQSLVRTLELNRLDEFSSLQKVASFATLVATYEKGFLLILEPFETDNATVPNPVFHFTLVIFFAFGLILTGNAGAWTHLWRSNRSLSDSAVW